MASPNFQAEHVASGQDQKEATINTAVDRLDGGNSAVLTVDFSGGDVTLTDDQFDAYLAYKLTNAPSAPPTLFLPASRTHRRYILNESGNTVTIAVTGASSAATTVDVADTKNRIVFSDGDSVYELSN